MNLTVVNNEAESRYEARTGETVAGYSVYQATASIMVIEHTEVDPAYEGQGIDSALVQGMGGRRPGQGSAQGACRVPVRAQLAGQTPRLPRPGVRHGA